VEGVGDYVYGTPVSLRAVPSSGAFTFVFWDAPGTTIHQQTTATVQLTMFDDYHVSAVFTRQ
jgi:hypothetical protein